MTGMPTAPESFVSVCQALYGDLIDPDAVWEDVAKRSPDQADMHVNGDLKAQQRDLTQRKVTAGLSAVGAGAGALGLVVGAREVRRKGWKATPRLTRALVPVEIAGLGGEIMATHILHGDTKKAKTLQPTGAVNKAFRLPSINMANLPKMDDIVAGSRKAMKDIVDSTKAKAATLKTTGPDPHSAAGQSERNTRAYQKAEVQAGHPRNQAAAVARQRGVDRWGTAAYHTTRVLGTPGGKVAAAGGGLALTGGGIHEYRKAKANAVYVDPYDSTTLGKTFDFEATGTISKIDDDKHLVFGWLSVSKINGAAVVDKQNDYIDPSDLEEAAYAYVHDSRIGGDMHGRGEDGSPRKVSDLVESMVFTPEKIEKMGLPASFPVGWWGGFKVHDEAAWEDVKKGKRTGFSVHGKGRRTDVDLDELMGA